MTPEHEWARMCQQPIADDSGFPAVVPPVDTPYSRKTRIDIIDHHRKLYELFIGCAELDDVSDRAKVMAYEAAIEQAKELGAIGVSPYTLKR